MGHNAFNPWATVLFGIGCSILGFLLGESWASIVKLIKLLARKLKTKIRQLSTRRKPCHGCVYLSAERKISEAVSDAKHLMDLAAKIRQAGGKGMTPETIAQLLKGQ